jgi:Glycosyltransferase
MSKDVLKDLVKFKAMQKVAYTPHPMYDNYGSQVAQQSAQQSLGLSSEYQYLLFFGFIRKYKGLDLLIQAMADPRLQGKKIKLIIAGEYYGDKKYYEELIATLNIRDRLELFTDFIPNDDVRFYFSACDVVVQPYRTATQSGISQIAYHFNKPMIVTNVGGLPEIVPHGKVGFVAEPDPQSIADYILSILNSETLQKMEENIKIERKKYEWSHFTQTIRTLMAEI